jgi:hypothetical protein
MSDIQRFPERIFKADIGGLGIVELKELSVKYRSLVIDDPKQDTPRNTLLDAGMTNEQIDSLRVGQVGALTVAVIEFTYPGLKKDAESITDDERDDLKKN